MQKNFLLIIAICVLNSCNKNEDYKLNSYSNANFAILENVGDTLLPTDTCYSSRLVSFQCTKDINNPRWIIGTNSYTSGSHSLDLIFPVRSEIDVKLIGSLSNNKDTSIQKHLTVLEPLDLISPLVGEYLGFNTDIKTDTFRISIGYWYGFRYPWWSEGAYSINNLPRNYIDDTQNFNGFLRPEIRGIIASTGYKNMSFDKSGNLLASGIKGYASLKRGIRDTLIVNYRIIDTVEYNQNNTISYLYKTFIGIKN